MAAVFAASAIGVSGIVGHEGWVTTVSPDPIGIPTGCAGVTQGVKPGQKLTDAACEQKTAQALVQIGLQIATCLPEDLPVETRAAFQSFAYNIGPAGFCKSRVAQHARDGNLGAACGDLRLYVYAGKRKLPGLVTRRAEEQAMCERGLRKVVR
jgi:lysozyme